MLSWTAKLLALMPRPGPKLSVMAPISIREAGAGNRDSAIAVMFTITAKMDVFPIMIKN
jgi:hypothetical protein